MRKGMMMKKKEEEERDWNLALIMMMSSSQSSSQTYTSKHDETTPCSDLCADTEWSGLRDQ
jgi:hypothetical protein